MDFRYFGTELRVGWPTPFTLDPQGWRRVPGSAAAVPWVDVAAAEAAFATAGLRGTVVLIGVLPRTEPSGSWLPDAADAPLEVPDGFTPLGYDVADSGLTSAVACGVSARDLERVPLEHRARWADRAAPQDAPFWSYTVYARR